jgi:hypothetical protein
MGQHTGTAGPAGVGTTGPAQPAGPLHGATALAPSTGPTAPTAATAPPGPAAGGATSVGGSADPPPPAGAGNGHGDRAPQADGKGAEGRSDLSGDVRSGLRWSVISQLAVRMISVASGIVLLRLLQPDEYGVYAFALAVVNILIAFNDLGQVLALARWPGNVAHAARTSTTLALGTSAVCFIACVAAAPLLAEVTDHPEATGVLRLLACMLLVDAVTTVPRALLFRDFKHSRTAIGDLVGTVANVGLSLSLAAAGTGTWARPWAP